MHSRLSNEIKEEALRLGFSACGIARAESVDKTTAHLFAQWIETKCHAEMAYMANYSDKRLDPKELMPEVESIVCVALNYTPQKRISPDQYQIAAYAYGKDYHDVVKNKLRQLSTYIETQVKKYINDPSFSLIHREFCDTAPVLERYWAVKAGLGWTGKHHQLIIPNAGSMFVLGEIFLNIPLKYDQPIDNRCGNCRKCIDACPTKALSKELFDACKCLSYQLIENRMELSDDTKKKMGNNIYGCDICQSACPWNQFAEPTQEEQFMPSNDLLNMTQTKWEQLTIDEYQRLFKGSVIKRVKYDGLMRNIRTAHDFQNSSIIDIEKKSS